MAGPKTRTESLKVLRQERTWLAGGTNRKEASMARMLREKRGQCEIRSES